MGWALVTVPISTEGVRGSERLSHAPKVTVGKWRSWDWIPAHWDCGAHALGVLDPGAFLLPSCPGEGMERQEVPSSRMCLVRKGGGRTAWPPGSRKKGVQRTGGTRVSWGLWVTSLGSPARLSSGVSGARARVTAWGLILLPSKVRMTTGLSAKWDLGVKGDNPCHVLHDMPGPQDTPVKS